MKLFQSSVFRALCSIAIGVLVLMYPVDIATWIVVAIGAMFLLSGIISCIAYFYAKRQASKRSASVSQLMPSYPVVGLGSVILGLILTLRPEAVVDIMVYVLGAMLVLGGVSLLFNLIAVQRFSRVPFFFWICPSLILLIGIVSIVKPEWIAGATMSVIGWCLLLYGVTEVINTIKINSVTKKYAAIVEAEEIEKNNAEDNDLK